MSKRVTKILSLILTLVMFLSVSTPAFALGGDELGEGWDREIGEDEVLEAHDTVEEAEEELDYFQTLDEDTGVQVTVEAPLGALPTLAELRVEHVEIEDVRETVEALIGEEPEILLALDISFWMNGREIEPEDAVRVKISAEELEGRDDLALIHLPDEDEPEALDLIDEEDLSFALGTNEIAFETDGFSTFIVTGSSRTATIHYGYLDANNAFVPFDSAGISSSSTSFPSSGSNLSASTYYSNDDYAFLVYDFPGYTYKETHLSTENGTRIWPVLGTVRNSSIFGSTYRFTYCEYRRTDFDDYDAELANNANIYLIYEPITATQGSSGSGSSSGGGSSDVPTLPASKDVEPNGDGTYNITLSVTGVEGTQVEIKRASVIVIFDLSGSMRYNMAGNQSYGNANSTVANINENARLSIAGKAVNALAETLLSKKDSQGRNLVQMALITFSDDATVHEFSGSNYTTDLDAYQAEVNGLSAEGGTNWEDALNEANALEVSTDTPTYVIFVSDGNPTYRISRMNDSDNTIRTVAQRANNQFYWESLRDGIFGSGRETNAVQTHYDAAKRTAQSIVSHNKKFYTIGVSTASTRMSTLASDAYNGNPPAGETVYFPGNDQDDLTEAFDQIASYVEEGLGFTNVVINDGVTEMTTVETDALTGKPSNFVYRKGTNTNPESNPVWTGDDVPEATITNDNHVVWNTSSIGKLEKGVTYSVTFTVWPSQESYDIIADINNGIIRNADGSIARTGTPAEAYAAQPDDVKAQIVIVGGVYTLKTNTGIGLTYKYNGADGEQSVTTIHEGSMPLATSYFAIHKVFHNGMDLRTANVLYKEVDGVRYLVDLDDEFILKDGEKIVYDRNNPSAWEDYAVMYIDLIITEGDEDYLEIKLTNLDNWTWDQLFIAPGVLTTKSDGTFELRETGRDYSVREKPGESYYWNLSAETYHPMVIDGVATVLQLVTEGAPTMEDNTFNGNYYAFGGNVYKKLGSADDALITAVNDRRSSLNITKVVEEAEGTEAPEDALFTYEITMDSRNDPHPGDEGYDTWYNTFWFSVQTDPLDRDSIVKEGFTVDGATAEDGNTGFYWFDNGGTVKVSIPANLYICFTNLPLETEYSIEELSGDKMPEGFVLKEALPGATGTTIDGTTYTPTAGEVDEDNPALITGTIDTSNSVYTAKYTNNYLGYFYVYHSSDLSVERFPMAVNGVAYKAASGDDAAVTFDIYALKKDGTLYGGYYSDYAGKSDGFDAAALFEGDGDKIDADGTAYTYQAIKDGVAWSYDDGFDTIGTAMVPVSNTVYYLKEVPTGYLMPYTHYTYYKDESKFITSIWTISATDDLNYQNAGFLVETTDKQAIMLKEMVITTEHSTSSVTLTAAKVFKTKKVLDGYLGYADINEFKTTDNTVLIRQYWTTKDGIQEFGVKMRQLSFGNCSITGLSKTDKDYEPLNAEP